MILTLVSKVSVFVFFLSVEFAITLCQRNIVSTSSQIKIIMSPQEVAEVRVQ